MSKIDKKYNDKDVRAANLLINKFTEKYGALSEPMVVARAIWNVFTNNNKERERSRSIIGRMLRDEAVIHNVEKNLFHKVEDVKVVEDRR